MKFQPDRSAGPSITGYGPGWVAVNGERWSEHLIVDSQTGASAWGCTGFETLNAGDFAVFGPMKPELVLFGSGTRLRFPHPSWLQALYASRIGVETMDTQAACRTYNFLAAEGRKVIAALLVED